MIDTIIQLLISGIAMGFIYSLVGMEYTLIYNSSGMLNFGHDKFIMLGAYIFAGTFMIQLGFPPVLAIILTLILMGFFGMLVASGIFIPLGKLGPNIYAVMGTILLGKIITEVARLIWGPNPFTVPRFLTGFVKLGDMVISKANIYIIVVALLVVTVLYLFFKKTKIGKAMRCIQQDKEASALMGINVKKMMNISVGLSAMICTIIGILVIPIFSVESAMANAIGIKGFASGVIGGFGNIFAAIVGGLIIGVVENLTVIFLPAVYKDVAAFVLMIMFLLIKPQGILGKRKK